MKYLKVLATMTICGMMVISPSYSLISNAHYAGSGELTAGADDREERIPLEAGVSAKLTEALREANEEAARKEEERKREEQERLAAEEAARKQQELEVALLDFQDTLKTRNETIINITNEIGPKYNIKPTLLQAMIWYESTNYQYAENRGCYGHMQVNPKWHYDKMEHHQVYDIYDQYGNILIGTEVLAELLEKNGGNLPLSLMQYNGDSRAKYLNSIGDMSSYARKIINLDYRLTLLEELYAEYQ